MVTFGGKKLLQLKDLNKKKGKKNLEIFLVAILKVTDENSGIRIRIR